MSNNDLYRFFIAVFILFTAMVGYAQETIVELTGLVTNSDKTVSNILVVNVNSNKSTITDHKGFFSIEVKSQDTLQFSAVQYTMKEIILTDEIINQKEILVDLKEKIINLDEVLILPHYLTGQIALDINKLDTKQFITSSSLGLPKVNIKVKTKNERLLFEADDGKLVKFYGIGLTVNFTKLVNMVSGKTEKLKNRVILDEHIKIENQIDNLFPKKVLTEILEIPQENIQDFLDFCIHQPDFLIVSETINPIRILEYFKDKSHVYKKAKGLE